MKSLRITFAGLALTAAGLLPATPSVAAPTETTRAGATSVALAAEFVNALASLGVQPGALGPGRLYAVGRRAQASFPITAGAVDLGAVKGEIGHAGGLSLKAGGTRVELSAFLIDLNASRPVLTGLAVVNDNFVLTVRNVKVTLAGEAASALNEIFRVGAFAKGFPIGTATVRAILDGKGHDRGGERDD
jgi:hypothetical protein